MPMKSNMAIIRDSLKCLNIKGTSSSVYCGKKNVDVSVYMLTSEAIPLTLDSTSTDMNGRYEFVPTSEKVVTVLVKQDDSCAIIREIAVEENTYVDQLILEKGSSVTLRFSASEKPSNDIYM